MSKYRIRPYDLTGIKTYPLESRLSKVAIDLFGRPHEKGGTVSEFLKSLPRHPGVPRSERIGMCHRQCPKQWKTGHLGYGWACHQDGTLSNSDRPHGQRLGNRFGFQWTCLVHDYEIALIGSTSEDVELQLQSGAFGMAEETGRGINQAIRDGVADGLGIGESLGRHLSKIKPPFGRYSLLLQAYLRSIPVTVHVTIGADIIHNHPIISPAATGEGSHRDFLLLAGLVAELNGGGVYLNCGSAVTMPEVFLKCVTLVRNSGQPAAGFYYCQS